MLRLAAGATSASAIAGIAANLLELTARRRGGRLLTLAATLGSWGVAFARVRHEQARAGSAPVDGREAEEDVTRVVSIPTAVASGPVVAWHWSVWRWPNRRSCRCGTGGRGGLGGTSNDRRTAGRAVAAGALAGVGYAALSFATGKLTHAGERLDSPCGPAPGRRGDRRAGLDDPVDVAVPGEQAMADDGVARRRYRARDG